MTQSVKTILQASLSDFKSSLKAGSIIFIIPLYQRDPAWKEDDITKFVTSFAYEKTFMGTLVLREIPYEQLPSPSKGSSSGETRVAFEVIDGQQRLLALTQENLQNCIKQHEDKRISLEELQKASPEESSNDDFEIKREFSLWADVEQEGLKIWPSSLLEKAIFNWIIYPSKNSEKNSADKDSAATVSSEALYHRINVDRKKLSVFSEIKSKMIEGDLGEAALDDWTKIENLFFERLSGSTLNISDLPSDNLREYLKKIEEQLSFLQIPDDSEVDWNLRQFLALVHFIVTPQKEKASSFFRDRRGAVLFKDSLRQGFDIFLEKDSEKKKEIAAVIKKLSEAIDNDNNWLLIKRPTEPFKQNTGKNNADAIGLLREFQLFSMAFQTWFTFNKYDHCALIWKYYYECVKELDGALFSEDDAKKICQSTLQDLYKDDIKSESTSCLNRLKQLLVHQIDVKQIDKVLGNVRKPSAKELWLADWSLYYLLRKTKREDDIAPAFSEAWNSAVRALYGKPLSEETDKKSQDKMKEVFRQLCEKYRSNNLVPKFSPEIEHWVARNSRLDPTISDAFLNSYGNLCLVPARFNKQLGNNSPQTKAYQVFDIEDLERLKREVLDGKECLLPKLVFSALVSYSSEEFLMDAKNGDTDTYPKLLIIFLTVFWAHFLPSFTPTN